MLYQLLFSTAGTPGTISKFDTNPRHLTNSLITDNGTIVAIAGMSVNGGTGIITFAPGQTFPSSGLPTAAGDVTGPFSALKVVGLQGVPLSSAAPTNSQVLQFNGANWAPATIPSSAGGTVTSVNTGVGLVGGPITSSGTIFIPNGAVTNAMLVNSSVTVNTGAGLSGGGTVTLGGAPINLANTGVLSFNGRVGAVVPAANDYSFAQLNGAAAVAQLPAAVAYTNAANTFSASQTVNGNVIVSGVGNSFIGNGSGLTNLQAGNLSGTIGVGNGGTGLAASGATGNYLRSNAGSWTSSAILSGDLPATIAYTNAANTFSANQTVIGNITVSGVGNSFTGNGSALTNLNGSAVSSGVVPISNLPASTTPTANLIPAADATGKIAAGWLPTPITAANYVSAYDTTTQIVAVANTFQDITISNNNVVNGWTHGAGTATFTCPQTGIYLVQYHGQASGLKNSTVTTQAVLNGLLINGSSSLVVLLGGNPIISQSFLASMSLGDVLTFQFTGTATTDQVGATASVPSFNVAIVRIG